MRKLGLRLENREGFTMILAVLLITVFIGAAAFAVDVSHGYLRRADVHAAADAAALAAVAEYAETTRSDSALKEAQAFAAKFKADTTHLTVLAADMALGTCVVPCTPTSNWTSPSASPNAAMVTVRYTGSYAFGPVLGIRSHVSTATSIAIGVPSKSVTKSTCVAPVVLSFSDLLSQLGLPSSTDTLTQANIETLLSAGPADTVNMNIPNGSQVSSLTNGDFYQVELPPVLTAGGVTQTGQNPSASEFKSAFTCTGGNSTVGVGDWLAIINGQDANQAKQGMNNADGGTYPATIEVALTGAYSNTVSPVCASGGSIKGCLQVKYLGAFTVTRQPDSKGVTGYFTALDPRAGGIVGTGTSPGPLAEIKTRLVY